MWNSDQTDEDGAPYKLVRQYPPAISRKEPTWLSELLLDLSIDEWHLEALLREIYSAIHNRTPALAVMGIRALLERIMIAKVGDQGTFSKNLDALESGGFVSKVQRECLDTLIEAGHAAMHRIYVPSYPDLNALLDITESIFSSIYLHRNAVEKIKKSIPLRGKP